MPHIFEHVVETMFHNYTGIWISSDDSGARKLRKLGMGVKYTKSPKFMLIINNLRYIIKVLASPESKKLVYSKIKIS